MPLTYDVLVTFLKRAERRAISESNAEVAGRCMVAKEQIDQAYRSFSPEEVPVDLSRLKRDLDIARDTLMAEAASKIKSRFAILVEMVSSVRNSDPSAFERLVGGEKGVILSDRSGWNPKDESLVLEVIGRHAEGITFSALATECGFGQRSTKRRDLHRFLHTMRGRPDSEIIVAGGLNRSTRYAIRSKYLGPSPEAKARSRRGARPAPPAPAPEVSEGTSPEVPRRSRVARPRAAKSASRRARKR